jgi:kynureninase
MPMRTPVDRDAAARLDADDPLWTFRREFVDSEAGTIYLDGNSLGRLPAATPDFLRRVLLDDWGGGLVRSWSSWIGWSRRLGDRLAAHALGADPGEVVICDSTSTNLYKLASAALDAVPERRTVLVDAEDFPTDRYILQGLARQRGLELVTMRSDPDHGLDPGMLARAMTDDVALVVLSHVSYSSGALLDLARINEIAHAAGAFALWDLSHSVGVVPTRLRETGTDLAVGATYKYLNGGPGAPAFLYVRAELQERLRQPIWGWFGQRDQFLMGERYEPTADIDRFLIGTPPLLSLAAIEPALDLLERVPVAVVREKSVRLGELAVELADAWLTPLGFRLASPRDPEARGSHVSFAHPEAARISGALRSKQNVICDFRSPDRLRVGMAPLYTGFVDVWDGLDRLRHLVEHRVHEQLSADLPRVT